MRRKWLAVALALVLALSVWNAAVAAASEETFNVSDEPFAVSEKSSDASTESSDVSEDTSGASNDAVSSDAPSDKTAGDVDGDGQLTMKDVLLIRKMIAGMPANIDQVAADMDDDGDITMKDVLMMRKTIANSGNSTTKTTSATRSTTTTRTTRATTTTTTPQSIQTNDSFVFHRNEEATVSIVGKPYTKYSITVYYKSGPSTAEGLEDKISDANGNVSWTWQIGGRTSPGTYRLVITGGGESIEREFTIVVD